MMSAQEERDREHERLLQDVIASGEDLKRRRSPLPYYLVATILVTLMVLWLVPPGTFPAKARLSRIPSLEEAMPQGMGIPQRPQSQDINTYISHDDPQIKLIAARVVTAACSHQDQRCYADALFAFVKDNIDYVTDPIGEYYETPQETLLAGAADCDGHAILLASLMRSVGILTRFSYSPNHVAVEAWLPADKLLSKRYTYEWTYYDPTCKECRPGQHMPGEASQ